MKKTICTLLAFLLCAIGTISVAETDLNSMTLEDLYALRLEINQEIAERAIQTMSADEGKTIIELFPDKVLARKVRDAIGTISINDFVTQDQLDKVTKIGFDPYTPEVSSLEGIQYLHNLVELDCFGQSGLTELPYDIGSLSKLELISLYKTQISLLPDSICNLKSLWFLSLSGTELTALPEDIGNLVSLEYLDVSNTKLNSFPVSIYALKLTTFNRDGLDID